MKLRRETDGPAELICYKRPDKKKERYSDYVILPVADAKLMDVICTASCGKKVIVVKRRKLYLYKNARIHLDRLTGLGTFIEFEVLVRYGKRQASELIGFLVNRFGIKNSDRIPGSY